jgi:hypothetical protein
MRDFFPRERWHLQDPHQASIEFTIHGFHVGDSNTLVQDHLVERDNEEGIQEAAMEDGQTNDTANEFEVIQMFRVDTRMRIDL